MKVYVGIPHRIVIADAGRFNPLLQKFTTDSALVVSVLLPKKPLLVEYKSAQAGTINDIPFLQREITWMSPLPDGYDAYVVSPQYAEAARQTGMDVSKLYVLGDIVYSLDGEIPLGHRGLYPVG